MAVVHVKHKEDYTVMANEAPRNNKLSLQAKGLLWVMMSRPHDWVFNVTELSTTSTNGRDATNKALNELIEHGFVKRISAREGGKFSRNDYEVSDTANWKTVYGKPGPEKPYTENPQLLSTEYTNYLKQNNELLNGVNNQQTETNRYSGLTQHWEQSVGLLLNPKDLQDLHQDMDGFIAEGASPDDALAMSKFAIDLTVEAHAARPFSYYSKIVKAWRLAKFNSFEAVKNNSETHKNQQANNASRGMRKPRYVEEVPAYMRAANPEKWGSG